MFDRKQYYESIKEEEIKMNAVQKDVMGAMAPAIRFGSTSMSGAIGLSNNLSRDPNVVNQNSDQEFDQFGNKM